MRVNRNKSCQRRDMALFRRTAADPGNGCPRLCSHQAEKSDIVRRASDSGVSGIREDPWPRMVGDIAQLGDGWPFSSSADTPSGRGVALLTHRRDRLATRRTITHTPKPLSLCIAATALHVSRGLPVRLRSYCRVRSLRRRRGTRWTTFWDSSAVTWRAHAC